MVDTQELTDSASLKTLPITAETVGDITDLNLFSAVYDLISAYQNHGVQTHRQLDCLLNSLLRLTTK